VVKSNGNVMSFCILRTAKLRTFGSIAGSAGHTFRELPTPNADPARTHLNVTIGANGSRALCAAVTARLPDKYRKDAVRCIEYLITASPEYFTSASSKAQNAYFKDATKWLYEKHGKENVVCLNMQLDETSPHLVAYVVPRLPDGRLSAKEFLGGRAKLRKMQSEFAERVGHPAGLVRGIEGSKAHHTTNKEFNAALKKNLSLQAPKPPAPSLTDRMTGRAKIAEEEYAAELAEHVALVASARNAALVGQAGRIGQAKAIARLRAEVNEMKGSKVEAEQLRAQTAKLVADLAGQKKHFQDRIASLKAALDAAGEKERSLVLEAALLSKQVDKLSLVVTDLQKQLRPKSGNATGLRV
jgi:hypothetical protein